VCVFWAKGAVARAVPRKSKLSSSKWVMHWRLGGSVGDVVRDPRRMRRDGRSARVQKREGSLQHELVGCRRAGSYWH